MLVTSLIPAVQLSSSSHISNIEISPAMSFFLGFLKRQFISWPTKPTFDYTSKTIIITGGSSGLALEAARTLLQQGAKQIIITCRDVSKGVAAKEAILASIESTTEDSILVWKLDLNSYASVIAFGERVKRELPRLDGLIANAAVMKTSFNVTEQDEETITTNVVSTTLLALLVYPMLKETAENFSTDTHLTFVGSELHEVARFKESTAPSGQIFKSLANEQTTNIRDRYNTSKLMLIFVMQQLVEMQPLASTKENGVVMNVVAPGYVFYFAVTGVPQTA